VQATPPAVIVADQRMPAMTGTEFLERSMAICPAAVRIILTGYTDNGALIDAINKSHIFRYLTKPWASDELELTLRRTIERFLLAGRTARVVYDSRVPTGQLTVENTSLPRTTTADRHEIVGSSLAIREVVRLIDKVAPSATTVLIEGETGTGKELVARA